MMKWAFLLCLAILSVSCNRLLKSEPAGLLSKSQMTDILVDMHLTEATIRAANDSISRLNDTADLQIRFADVFRKHDITPGEFNLSLDYYLEQIDELDKIYSEVISRLVLVEAIQQQLASQKPYVFLKGYNSVVDTASLTNPWHRALHKSSQPGQTQYFDPLILRKK